MLSAISRASAYAAGSSSSAGYTRETSRPSSASAAGKTRPVAAHSMAWAMPTILGRNQLEAASVTMPRRANTNPKRAVSEASRTSMGSVIVTPTPTAGPLIAPMTGLSERAIRSATVPPPSRGTPSTVSPSEVSPFEVSPSEVWSLRANVPPRRRGRPRRRRPVRPR